jgi:eukaryotic-like serine/threonine-protein kinase
MGAGMQTGVDPGRLPPMETGQVLGGRYELAERLGKGGMAVVWLARDRVLGRTVAVKVLAAHHLDDPESLELIRAEARAAAALSHPNIAQVHDYGESDLDGRTVPYLVMELVRGDTLRRRLAEGPVPPAAAMRLCGEVAAALAAAHADGLVHRDIKPANVMLTPDGAKVVDFGIAAMVDAGGTAEPPPEVLGTPAYLAPERLIDDAVEPASDVYALGMLLYRLLAGHPPWDTETTTQMLRAHIYVEPAPLPAIPGVPEHIIALCNRCLRKDPTERPSAREVAALLTRAANTKDEPVSAGAEAAGAREEPAVAAAVPSAAAVGSPAGAAAGPAGARRRSSRVLAMAALLCLLAGAIAWLLWPSRPDGAASALPAVTGSSAPAGTAVAPSPAADRATPVNGATAAPAAPGAPGPARTDEAVRGPVAGPTAPAPTTAAAGTATPAPDPTTTAPDAPPQERTLSSTAGSVRATCPAPDTARLLSWTAQKPYKVMQVDAGPAAAPSVTFKHGGDVVTMTVTCSGGVPTAG